MDKQKYIGFVGDSYCSVYNEELCPEKIGQRGEYPGVTYTSLVARHFDYQMAPYGFGGRSWWWSWYNFSRRYRINQFEAVIFCHTNCDRINSSTHEELPHMCNSNWPNLNKDMNLASEYYFKYIIDSRFDSWAHQQYFKMLKEKCSDIKTIHFHSFPDSIKYSNLLPGMVYNTPLIYISVGEIDGTAEQIQNSYSDNRANHLNEYNNRVLADVIINALDNYTPGHYKLPLEKFDQLNPNAKNWPNGIFWTK